MLNYARKGIILISSNITKNICMEERFMNGKWTFKLVLKNKLIQVLIITLVLTYGMVKGINQWLNYYLNRDAVWMKQNYSIGIFSPVIFILTETAPRISILR